MINAEDDVFIDVGSSCTRDEAVIKLLGWRRGAVQKIQEDSNDPIEQLFQPGSRIESLSDRLQTMRNAAREALLDASELPDFDDSKFIEMTYSVDRITALARRAAEYLADISEETSKGEQSELLIDRYETDATRMVHLTRRSLDRWATKRYGLSIDEPDFRYTTSNPADVTQTNVQRSNDEDGNPSADTKEKNLYVTLALLADCFANATPGGTLKSGDTPNALEIAKRLVKRLGERGGASIGGQAEETVRKRISEAEKILRMKLEGRL